MKLNENERVVLLEADRDAYRLSDINTMTIGEMIDYLKLNYDLDQKLFISSDNGYTYGGIFGGSFREKTYRKEDDE